MTTFKLKSIEHRTYTQEHNCVVRKEVDGNKILVEIDPPIPAYVYDLNEDIDLIVLAPRYEGTTLVPTISEWPCIVNMCIPKEHGNWESGPWRLLDIGEISK